MKKETRFERSAMRCRQQKREQTGEKTENHRNTEKKKQEMNKKEWQVFTKEFTKK